MAQAGFTPISLYYSTTASAVPTAGNLVAGELALNTNDGKLYYKNSSNVVTLLASTSGASGDVVGPASATANGVALFDGTTGKLLQSPSTITYASSTLTLPTISPSANLAFTGTGNRITGDFSNATVANRVLIQTSTTNGNTNLTLIPNGTGANVSLFLDSDSATTNSSRLAMQILGASEARITSGTQGSGTALPLTMHTGGSERLRIDTSGNVGIGTSSPNVKLDVNGISGWAGSTTGIVSSVTGANASIGNGGNLRVLTSTTQGADVGGSITLGGYYIGTSNSVDFAEIAGRKENATSGNSAGYLQFGTRPNGGNLTERMRIDSSGNVGIGVTPASNYGPLQVYTSTNGTAASFGNGAFVHAFNSVAYFSSNSTLSAAGAWTARATSAASVAPGTGTIQFFTDSGLTNGSAFTPTERMRIDSSGNVGIGTTNPLGVYGAALAVVSANTFGTITAKCTATTGAAGIVAKNDADTSDVFMYSFNSASGSLNAAVGTSKAQPLALFTNNTERMRITSAGLVGIGETTPANTLAIKASQATIRLDSSTGTSGVYGQFVNTAGSFYVGRDSSTGGIFGTAYASVLYSEGAYPMIFYTTGTERLRIDSSGNALFAKAVRATITTDNDLSFDMNAASNFKCTPTAGGALTFTNITSGQTGNIILVNNSNYAITAAATTKVSSTCLATISATGTYWLSYYSDGTNVYVANTGALA